MLHLNFCSQITSHLLLKSTFQWHGDSPTVTSMFRPEYFKVPRQLELAIYLMDSIQLMVR